MADVSKYTAEQVARLRESFVDNECESDEYRETQPNKGMQMIANAVDILSDEHDSERLAKLAKLTAAWLTAWANEGLGAYAGADELTPALTLVFDILWEHGEHPYFSTEELDAWLADDDTAAQTQNKEQKS